jgi:very-short-patch-repair endonuclease
MGTGVGRVGTGGLTKLDFSVGFPSPLWGGGTGKAGGWGSPKHGMSIRRARKLRRSMSPAEAVLWTALRHEQFKPFHFRRQVPIGPYYADFASHTAKLVVEVDGTSHFEDAAVKYDARRDEFIRSQGFSVLRVTTLDVHTNLDGVAIAILAACMG